MFTMNAEMKAAVVAALAAHGGDRLALVGLGRIARDDSALASGAVIAAWPAEADGTYRIALNDTAGLIVWRSFILAEIAAGRGDRQKIGGYEEAFGVKTEWAFGYVVAATKGLRIRPCSDADHDNWSEGTWFVVESGAMDEPRKRWARSAWRQRAKAHEALAEAGLAIRGRSTWNPRATCLFDQPEPVIQPPALSSAEDEALMHFAA